jgi:cation transport regulator ChaB
LDGRASGEHRREGDDPEAPMPASKEELPDTLKRSAAKVQRTYMETLDSAHAEYGSEERAHRTAWAAVKHIAEKKGDRWVLKDTPGPSDAQAAQSGRQARDHPKQTRGGVDVRGNTKQELYERAKRLGVPGRSRMTKDELAKAIARKQ